MPRQVPGHKMDLCGLQKLYGGVRVIAYDNEGFSKPKKIFNALSCVASHCRVNQVSPPLLNAIFLFEQAMERYHASEVRVT